MLRAHGISGWKLRPNDVMGRPDIFFPLEKIAIFLDGCFWHGCEECFQMPVQNRSFWEKKIKANRERDRVVSENLESNGYSVIRIWEHDLERKTQVLESIINELKFVTSHESSTYATKKLVTE